ncbi:MAG: hypothetical protein A2Y23_07725 [Clostridiales bacterium GWB2_37_7]|nr:MAG: hypothetical protein A2Y23_07725 [Clostridiales bacterium GWB2_37_7]
MDLYEFAIGSSSPYGKIKESAENVAIYNGALDYYVKNKVEKEGKEVYKYKDLKTDIELADENIEILKKESKNKVYKSKNEKSANSLRDILISAQKPADLEMTVMSVSSKIISGVPDYQWYQGCSPTSAAMVLKYRWPSLPDESTLIEELAGNMGTNGSGGTNIGMIPMGISSTMHDHGMIVSSWNDGAGRTKSTLSEYSLQINSNKPVVVTVVNNTQPAPGYPSGYKTHTMAGVGYYKSSVDGNFIIVHDTNTNGEMYLDFDASSFGTNYWTYVD